MRLDARAWSVRPTTATLARVPPHGENIVPEMLARRSLTFFSFLLAQAGITVLDIGTGTGILAVMAARAGASKVYACEVNSVLCDIAREVVKRWASRAHRLDPPKHTHRFCEAVCTTLKTVPPPLSS